MNTHVIENDLLQVTVSDAGAELISVIDRDRGSERIWIGDPAVWNRHAPILRTHDCGHVHHASVRVHVLPSHDCGHVHRARDHVHALRACDYARLQPRLLLLHRPEYGCVCR